MKLLTVRKSMFAVVVLVAAVGVSLWSAGRISDSGSRSLPSVEEHARQVSETTTPFQRAILDDGQVTLAEFEDARAAAVSCARNAGATVNVEAGVGLRPSSYSVAADSEAALETAVGKLRECEREHSEDVASAWALQKAHFTSEDLTRALGALRTCLSERAPDYLVPELTSFADLEALVKREPEVPRGKEWDEMRRHYSPCKKGIEEATGFALP
jgi:hypothetical protein